MMMMMIITLAQQSALTLITVESDAGLILAVTI